MLLYSSVCAAQQHIEPDAPSSKSVIIEVSCAPVNVGVRRAEELDLNEGKMRRTLITTFVLSELVASLASTKDAQIDHRVSHQLEAKVPTLEALEAQQQALELVFPCKGSFHF